MKLFYFVFIIIFACPFFQAQNNSLIITPNIKLPKDSVDAKQLINNLKSFLLASQVSKEQNNWIYLPEKVETIVLMDELLDVEKNAKLNDEHFYKPYLNNIVLFDSSKYLIQISYTGIKNDTVFNKMSFDLIAHKNEKQFLFSSRLKENTNHWKRLDVGQNTFYYKSSINMGTVNAFKAKAEEFDKKLKVNKQVVFYCCKNMHEALQLIGINYKSDYNGRTQTVLAAKDENKKLVILGNKSEYFDEYDLHDLWHDRLSLVISRSLVNKPIDEGCAYLYGGSWGLTWNEIFKEFKLQVATNDTVNWLRIKENPILFNTKTFKNSADYIVNALIIKKIEKEKGFDGVWEFLNCGKQEKGNENYYQSLEKLTGINKSNYNQKVWALIKEEK